MKCYINKIFHKKKISRFVSKPWVKNRHTNRIVSLVYHTALTAITASLCWEHFQPDCMDWLHFSHMSVCEVRHLQGLAHSWHSSEFKDVRSDGDQGSVHASCILQQQTGKSLLYYDESLSRTKPKLPRTNQEKQMDEKYMVYGYKYISIWVEYFLF